MAVAAAAEHIRQLPALEYVEPEGLAPVVVIPNLARDNLTRHRSAHFIGEAALSGQTAGAPAEQAAEPQIESLWAAVQLAAEGHAGARRFVETCVRADAVERTRKVRYVTSIDMEVDADNNIHGQGQILQKTQANSIVFASNNWQMAERVGAETNNVFRLNEAYWLGELNDNYLVEFSPTADNMTRRAMQDEGFFVDTMSCAIRATTAEGNVLPMESAFVAGVKTPRGPRHDIETIIKLGRVLGVDLSGKSATEIIDTPLLIPKRLMPNGVIDLVALYDRCAGGTFFGQDKPQEDYLAFRAACRRQEAGFEPKVREIVEALLAEAPGLRSQVEATERLAELSEAHMVERAIADESIDPRVFGDTSAASIMQARHHRALGNVELERAATGRAKRQAVSYSCPGGSSKKKKTDVFGTEIEEDSADSKEWHGGKIHHHAKCRSCHEVKDEVGACFICQDCVKQPPSPYRYKRQPDKPQSKAKSNLVSLMEKIRAKEAEQADQARARKAARLAVAAA